MPVKKQLIISTQEKFLPIEIFLKYFCEVHRKTSIKVNKYKSRSFMKRFDLLNILRKQMIIHFRKQCISERDPGHNTRQTSMSALNNNQGN